MKKKIIIKGLTLLDGCLDLEGNIIPGKSTLIICDDDEDLLKFVSGILNSKVSIFLLNEKYASSSYNGGVNFNKEMIDGLLVPNNYNVIWNKIINIVNEIVKNKIIDELSKVIELEEKLYVLKESNPFISSVITSLVSLSKVLDIVLNVQFSL